MELCFPLRALQWTRTKREWTQLTKELLENTVQEVDKFDAKGWPRLDRIVQEGWVRFPDTEPAFVSSNSNTVVACTELEQLDCCLELQGDVIICSREEELLLSKVADGFVVDGSISKHHPHCKLE